MNVLIIFDLSESQEEIKKKLMEKGYYNSWYISNPENRTYLPKSTLWKNNIELKDALNDLHNTVIEYNQQNSLKPKVNILRSIAVPASPWEGINGVPI